MPRISKVESDKRTRLKALAAASQEYEGWDQGREVLTPVRSVRTIFPQFDIATRVMGLPIERVTLVHGPSNHGKTVFLLGLGKSFLERENFYFHVDAEFTTPEPWVKELLKDCADYPTFKALRPRGYEDTADKIRKACATLVMQRDRGLIPPETTALFGLDSLQKLVPEGYLQKLAKEGGIDPQKGRGGMLQAALNSAWMKELVPMMYHANAGIVLLSRESENTDPAKGMFDPDYKVAGGKAPYYDSSLVCRITRNGWVEKGGTKKKKATAHSAAVKFKAGDILGERHLVQVMKTKVGQKDAKITKCYFHTSNGKLIPAGFDQGRDVIELALASGTLKKDGGHKLIDQESGEVYGTTHNACVYFHENPETLRDLMERTMEVAQPDEEEEIAS